MKRLFAVCLCVGSLVRVGSAVVIPVNCNLFYNGTNTVQIAWNAHSMRFGISFSQETGAHLRETLPGWQRSTLDGK